MGIIKQLKDKLGNLIYPQTLTKAVYDESGNRLDNTLATLNSNFKNKFKTISGDLLTQAGTVNVSYPSGFNSSNTMVVAFGIIHNGVVYHQNDLNSLYVTTDSNGIHIYNSVSAYFGNYYVVELINLDL